MHLVVDIDPLPNKIEAIVQLRYIAEAIGRKECHGDLRNIDNDVVGTWHCVSDVEMPVTLKS